MTDNRIHQQHQNSVWYETVSSQKRLGCNLLVGAAGFAESGSEEPTAGKRLAYMALDPTQAWHMAAIAGQEQAARRWFHHDASMIRSITSACSQISSHFINAETYHAANHVLRDPNARKCCNRTHGSTTHLCLSDS